jgi:hypothetical protein
MNLGKEEKRSKHAIDPHAIHFSNTITWTRLALQLGI